MKLRFSVLALGSSGVLFWACFPSLDGLSGGGGVLDGGGASDAGRPADGGTDVPLNDADAAAPIEAGPWCAANGAPGTFCCDFDTTDLSVFNNTTQFNGGTAVLDTTAASSLPRSLLCTTPAGDAGTDAGAFSQGYVHYISSPAQTSVAEVALSFRIDKAATIQAVGLVVFRFVGPDRNYETRLLVNEDLRLFISEFDSKTLTYSEPFRMPEPVAVGKWIRVKYRAELLAAGSGRADLDVDGKRVVTAVALKPFYASGNLRTDIGATYVRLPNDGWTVRIDDLLITPK